jgi:putative transposase
MPWKEVKPMNEKTLFIADYVQGDKMFAELCRLYGISRKTGYKWISRYERDGFHGLDELSRKPHSCPHRTPYAIRKEIMALRQKRINPGPKKIQTLLLKKYAEADIPSKTTIYNILRLEGLVKTRKLRRHIPPGPKPFEPAREPNDLWTADFKGQFLTGDRQWCFPLTVMDDVSRYLLGCRGLDGTGTPAVKKEFDKLFREYGLPLRIRTDNGVPFASLSTAGISQLSKWWIRLGIVPERIERGKPQQNGNHERMHRTLKDAVIKPPAKTRAKQQGAFDRFRMEYNEERPHESLGQETPASKYRTSFRHMPKRLPELEYPNHYRIASVLTHGIVSCFGKMIYVGHLLTGERVGMDEVDDGVWIVYYGPVRLGRFDLRDGKNKWGYMKLKV